MAGPTVKNSAYSSKPSNNQPRLAASRMFHWLRLSEWYHGCDATTVSDMRTLVVHKRAAGGTPGPKSLAIRAVSEHPTRGCRTLQGAFHGRDHSAAKSDVACGGSRPRSVLGLQRPECVRPRAGAHFQRSELVVRGARSRDTEPLRFHPRQYRR